MKQAKEFVPIRELKALSEWQSVVMESEIPVILDCYAEWCAPCKKLEPILKEKVLEQNNKLLMVKLNIEDFP